MDTDLSRKIGERLHAARNARGLTLAQLSTLTDGIILKSRISNFEQGVRRPSVEVATLLAEALGNVSPGHLLCLDLEFDEELSPEENLLLARYRRTDERGRKTLLMLAEQTAKR